MDTSGWVSMDGHVHSENSIDSRMALTPRVTSAAGEGLEVVISTDHNFVSDWRPQLAALGLTPWLATFVGIEFTTLESGHFNSYPLDYKVGPVTHGAFEWFGRPPDELFAGLRQLADPAAQTNIIVQPPTRFDPGLFQPVRTIECDGRHGGARNVEAAGRSKRKGIFRRKGKSRLSYGCDALEILNGKLGHQIHSVRVPTDWPKECYKPLPSGFDPKTMLDPCSANGKILRPSARPMRWCPEPSFSTRRLLLIRGLVVWTMWKRCFPGAVDDWFHMLNQDSVTPWWRLGFPMPTSAKARRAAHISARGSR